MSAAESLFHEQGYEATTIAQIGEKANVSAVTVFNYYKTKGELLLALIADENAVLLQKLSRLAEKEKVLSPDQLAFRFFSTVTRESLKKVDKKSWRQVIATCAVSGESEFSMAYEDLRNQLKKHFAKLLKKQISAGRLSIPGKIDTFVDVAYSHHYQLFIDLISKDKESISRYSSALKAGLSLLFAACAPEK